jgi:predicted HTH domain antitoxin
MKPITISLPETIDMTEKEILTALAAQLYEMGKLSLGQSADLAGYSKSTFIELLGTYKVSLFNYPVEEIESDLRNAEGYHS